MKTCWNCDSTEDSMTSPETGQMFCRGCGAMTGRAFIPAREGVHGRIELEGGSGEIARCLQADPGPA